MIDDLARVRMVLIGVSHPGNIGSAARAMWTMGLSRLILVAPRRFPAPEAMAMASGAGDILENVTMTETLSEALIGCAWSVGFSARPRKFAGKVFSVREVAQAATHLLVDAGKDQEIAFVFGTEMSGLSNAELAQCSVVATIPANERYSSLNLAAAVQVAAYEMRVALLSDAVWRAPRFTLAKHEEVEKLFAHAQQTLIRSGFLDPGCPKRLMPRLRRLFARTELEREEVNILRGILSQMDKWIKLSDKKKQ
ncbi:MAG: RNA methyltransferase [Burkholderiales bacterium]|nr:RNA methyltransferase [Burkholderiales bacterium]